MINAMGREKAGGNSKEYLSWGGRSLPENVTFELRLQTAVKDIKKI